MKVNKLFFLMLMSLSPFFLQAQSISDSQRSKWIVGPSLGYQYQKQSFLKASMWALTDLGYANYLRLDAGANFARANKVAHLIPELGLTYYLGAKGVWPFIKTELTPYTLTPKVGIGVFNLLEVGGGYGFLLKTRSNLPEIKGFNISVSLNLPLNYHLY